MSTRIDWDDDEHDDVIFWDDEDFWRSKEEPDCYACNDGGCRSCSPTWLQYWWWRFTHRLSWRLWRFRTRHEQYSDEPPF